MKNYKVELGETYGSFLVASNRRRGYYVECLCDCGVWAAVPVLRLTSGKSTSCGCRGTRPSPELRAPTFSIWLELATSLNTLSCLHWCESFRNFTDDMGLVPHLEAKLDLINPLGIYEPGNCVWA